MRLEPQGNGSGLSACKGHLWKGSGALSTTSEILDFGVLHLSALQCSIFSQKHSSLAVFLILILTRMGVCESRGLLLWFHRQMWKPGRSSFLHHVEALTQTSWWTRGFQPASPSTALLVGGHVWDKISSKCPGWWIPTPRIPTPAITLPFSLLFRPVSSK